MTKGDKVTVTTPWWDEPREGVITKKFTTPVENYYVIEFPDGEVITMKESELPKDKWLRRIDFFILSKYGQGFPTGFALGLWEGETIDYAEYCRLTKYIAKKESK